MIYPVLTTRFIKPRITDAFIQRPHLINRLDMGLIKPFTLIVAGGGYGKSILVSQWLDTNPRKYCWISLESDCNDWQVFLSYVISCIISKFPGSMREISDILNATEMPPIKVVIQFFLNDLNDLEENLTVVLDDYHLIRKKEIHEIINELTRFPIEKLHLTIITRKDPPLRLNSLKLYDKVNEIRMTDFKLSSDEIILLSEKILNTPLDSNKASQIFERTEGWILVIRLILGQMNSGNKILEEKDYSIQNKGMLSQYLLDEIMNYQNPIVKKGLMLASLFERFNLDLIGRLLFAENNIVELTENQIKKEITGFIDSSMFIYQLDDENKWFRFHHLIRDFLQQQGRHIYTEKEIASLYQLGSNYFEGEQFFEEAIKYALKSGDISIATTIIDSNKHHLLNTDQFSLLNHWLQLLPPGSIEKQPSLLLARAMIHDTSANYTAMLSDLENARSQLAFLDKKSQSSKLCWGEYFALNAACNYYTGKVEESLENSKTALELLRNNFSYIHDFAMGFRVFALNTAGQSEKARILLDNELKRLPISERRSLMRNKIIKVLLFLMQGNISEIIQPASLVFEIGKEKESWINCAMAVYSIITVHYEKNESEEIAFHKDETFFNRFSGRPFWNINISIIQAMGHFTKGNMDEFRKSMSMMHEFAKQFQVKAFEGLVYAFETEMEMRMNNLQKANEISKLANFEPYPPVYYIYFPQLTKVKLLLMEGGKGNLEEAKELLDKHLQQGKAINLITFQIKVLALYALWYVRNDKLKEAVNKLEEALQLARPRGFIRTFIDLGDEMFLLLRKLNPGQQDDPYVRNLLRIFRNQKTNNSEQGTLALDLTTKELEIMRLVAQGFKNNGIAERLFLSEATIKTYIYRIYQKLGVKNRTAAVQKVNEMLSS